jgi:hypothetical protein
VGQRLSRAQSPTYRDRPRADTRSFESRSAGVDVVTGDLRAGGVSAEAAARAALTAGRAVGDWAVGNCAVGSWNTGFPFLPISCPPGAR